jgi:hypothetical protein
MAVDQNKVHRMDFTRVELLEIFTALHTAFDACDRPECEVCDGYKAIAARIERKLPRSMVASPTAYWRKRGDTDA